MSRSIKKNLNVAHYVIFLLFVERSIGSLPGQIKKKANLRDYNIQSRSSLCWKKLIWVYSLHVINMCSLLQLTSPNMKYKCIHSFNDPCIQLHDASDNWSNHVERSLIVAIYQAFLCHQRNTEMCSVRKHCQHEAHLLSKGHLRKGERIQHETNMSWQAKHVKTRSRGESQQIL